MYVRRNEVQFRRRPVIKTSEDGPAEEHTFAYRVLIPDFLDKWDVWDYWEKCRFASMQMELTRNDVLFDIGTETGWIAVIYAGFVGAGNMVLFEPSPDFWPNIQVTWRANNLDDPKACYLGLVGERTVSPKAPCFDLSYDGIWPRAASGEHLTDVLLYRYLHNSDHLRDLPQTSLDDWCDSTGIRPTALTIDVEGAELHVLRGAQRLLNGPRMKIWVSVHPDLMERDHGVLPSQLMDFMSYYGYHGTFLCEDHEQHWLFR